MADYRRAHELEDRMGFLAESDAHVRDGPLDAEVKERRNAEAAASGKPVGSCPVDRRPQFDSSLGELSMHDWMRVTVTPLEPHRNDPGYPG